MSEPSTSEERIDFSAPSLALTLLFAAIGYSLPFALYPQSHPFNGEISPEILNLYFLVAWMGLAHFVYAYYGQFRALLKTQDLIAPFLIAFVGGGVALFALRHLLGYMMFSFVMWVYFLPHFVRAEIHFANVLEKKNVTGNRGVYFFPAVAFTFFTIALFGPEWLTSSNHFLYPLALVTLGIGFAMGLRGQLRNPEISRFALLAIFLIAEGIVWATYRKYMVFQFQQGVYVFHIAMASFYHYFRAYDFAGRMGIFKNSPSTWKFTSSIFVINILVVLTGVLVVYKGSNTPANFVFDVSFFTFWVGLHQYASDVFMLLKQHRMSKSVGAGHEVRAS